MMAVADTPDLLEQLKDCNAQVMAGACSACRWWNACLQGRTSVSSSCTAVPRHVRILNALKQQLSVGMVGQQQILHVDTRHSHRTHSC